jgi:myo-inositol 2-dehydrogenase/D-chiro-inositol 1-dehydrogenase
MIDPRKPSRREFLTTSGVVAAGAVLAGGLSLSRSVHASGADAIKVALIGCGGRGSGAVRDCLRADPAVKVIALADSFENRARGAAKGLRKEFPDRVDLPDDRVFAGLDAYEKAIAAGPDVVILTTPPGFRPLHYAAAIKAGKHVFMEKPCCVDAGGYRSLVETNKLADEKGLKVVVGLQRRHDAGYLRGIEELHAGKAGKILFMRAYWNGSGIWIRRRRDLAKQLGREPTEMEYQVNNWYHFCWLSGDNICEQHVHNLDVCNWANGGQHPVEANGMGGCSVRYAGENKGVGQIFDHHFVEFTYADGSKMFSQCRHIPNTWSPVSEAIHGTLGTSDAHSVKLYTTEGKVAEVKKEPRAKKGAGRKAAGGTRGPGAMVQEHMDLIAAIRKNEKHNEGHYGATSSFTAVLGRMATYSGQIIRWDDAVAKGTGEFPARLAWDADPPVKPDKNGDYPIPVPGMWKAY